MKRSSSIQYLLMATSALVFSSCMRTNIDAYALNELYESDKKRSALTTIQPSMAYMGKDSDWHYIKYIRGGSGMERRYRLSSKEVSSDIDIEVGKVPRGVPCRIRKSKEVGGGYRISRKTSQHMPIHFEGFISAEHLKNLDRDCEDSELVVKESEIERQRP